MAIKTTQPFSFNSKLPNFERDTIDSLNDYYNHHPLRLTTTERYEANNKYDVGHIVYDKYTTRHYVWLGLNEGWGIPSVQTLKFKFAEIGSEDDETLYLDGSEHSVVGSVGTAVFLKTDGKPLDWDENYSEYYLWNASDNTYHRNTNPVYNNSTEYYLKTFSTMFV